MSLLNLIKNIEFESPEKKKFYKENKVVKVEWWLAECNFYPDLFWARLRVFTNGTADVLFQDEHKSFGFDSEQSARWFLSEEEFTTFQDLDKEDKNFLEIPLNISIETPNWLNKEVEYFEYIGKY